MEQIIDAFFFRTVLFLMLFLCIIALYINVIRPFADTRKYIKTEMTRADEGEYDYWKHELKNLYIDHIPILRWFIRRFKR